MSQPTWSQHLQRWRGNPVEQDLSAYRPVLEDIARLGTSLSNEADEQFARLFSFAL